MTAANTNEDDGCLELQVNGCTKRVSASPQSPLLYVLRNDLGLKGTRFGCGGGLCGACMVLVDGKPAFSCDTPLWVVRERQITTIEGVIASRMGALLVEAFVTEQAAQCGYCLSGIVVSAAALLSSTPAPLKSTIAQALCRNLCRCGTHTRILKAVQRAVAALSKEPK